MVNKILAVLAVICTAEIVSAAPNKVVCYHGTWSTYRWGNGLFTVDDIDPTLCTHLIYSFVGIEPTGKIKHLEENLDINKGNLKKFAALKQRNSKLKTLIAIGGWNQASDNFTLVVRDPVKRAVLVNDAINLIQTYGFDGFDLDWEYPNQRGGSPADIQNFVLLIQELRKAFDRYGYELTAAVAAAENSVSLSYDVPGLSQYLDLIHVMTYDLHGSWDGVTGQNAPLYPSTFDTLSGQQALTVDAAIRGWIKRGADPAKLALGIGTYGRTYSLSQASNNKLGAPVSGAGNPGKYTGEAGMIGYNEIAEVIKEGGWNVVWDDVQKTPYAYKGNQWIGYDNPQSVAVKVEYAKSLNLGGIMIWSIETDDFKGISGTKYPILRTINQALGGIVDEILEPAPAPEPELPEPAPAPAPGVTEAPAAPVEPPKPDPKPEPVTNACSQAGYVRDPNNCAAFYYCLPVNGAFIPLTPQLCPGELLFDEKSGNCLYPSQVSC